MQAIVAILLLFVGSAMAAEGSGSKPTAPAVDKTSVAKKIALLPLSFEANQGQTDARVKFLSRGPGYTMFLTGQDTVLSLQNGKRTDALRLHWIGSKHSAALEGAEPLSLKSNYFLGSDPKKWRTNVPNYGRVLYKSLYDGIDLAFYGSGGRLENDFLIGPNADPAAILLGIEGASRLNIEADGTLSMKTASGAVRLLKPVAYQQTKDGRREVETSYQLLSGNRVRLKVGAYDHSQPLVIDPVIDYMTYISTATTTSITVNAAAVDSSNNLFVTGYTTTTTFPSITATTPTGATSTFANKDVFVLKLDNNGAASVVVFLGGSGDDIANGIAVGSANNVYITGQTKSNNFPVTSPTFQSAPAGTCNSGTHICTNNTAFVTKLSNNGSQVLYSTYIGGSGDDIANAIAVSSPRAYITGTTTSTSSSGGTAFPHLASAAFANLSKTGNTDGFVAVLTANTESIPTTSPSCGPFATTCAPITCTGKVATINFAATTSFKAGDVVTIANAATGGNHSNDFNGTVTLTSASGTQATYALTACNGASAPDWSSGGTVVGQEIYGSYFGANAGSTGTTSGNAIAIDSSDFADITGSSTSAFNTSTGAQTTFGGGTTDAIVTQFDPTQSGAGSQNFATFLGGAGNDVGTAIVVDASDNIYVGGSTTSTETTSKLCNSGAGSPFAHTCNLQAANGGGTDGFIVKLNSSGTTISFSTYLGGSGTDSINRLRWDGTNLYAAGTTTSTGFLGSLVMGALSGTQDGFVASINPATPAINYGAYVGGNGNNDAITGFVLDPTTATAWYAVGNTDSSDLSTTASSYQPVPAQTISAGTPVAGFAAHYNVVTTNTTTLTVTANAATVNNSSAAPGLASPGLIWYDSNTANSDITFPFIVTNGATNPASDVVFNLVIPNISNAPPLNITSVTPNGGTGTCATPVNTASYSAVTCKVSSLATSAAQEFDVRTSATSTAASNTGSTVTLTASAAGANANKTTGSATGLTIVPVAKLTVTNTATIPNNSSLNATVNGFGPYHDSIYRLDFDTSIEWDFSVANAGPGAASDAQFTLVLPTGTSATNVSETNSACATALSATTVNTMPAVTCTLKPIAASSSLTVKILMNPPATPAALATAGTGTWVDPNNNALGVSVVTNAGGYADDGSTHTTTYGGTVRRESSVAVTVTPTAQTGIHQGDAINPGGTPAGYSVTVSNAGPSQATNVLLGFTLDTTGTAPEVGGALTGIRVTGAGSGYTSAPAVNITGGGGTGASATATISAQVSNTITIATPGSGYTNPVVTISGGGGTGATATATQAGGAINNITVTNQGSGYAFPPKVTITDGGYGAAATAQISGGVVTGFTILNGGSGYITPTVTLVGGDGTGATATAVVTGGVITAINVGSGGANYNTTAPTVVITETGGGPGTGATATATLVNGTVAFVTLNNAGTGYSTAPTVTAGSGAATFAAGGSFAGSNFTNVAFTGTNCSASGNQQVNCTVTTPLVPGVPYNMSVTAKAPATIHPSAGTQSFDSTNAATTALVSSTTTLGAGGLAFGSSATFSTQVQRQADLAVASFYDNSPVNLSGTLAYTTAIQNNPNAQANNDDAEGVVVTYTFPNGSVLQTTTPNSAGYVTDDYGTGQCTVPTAAKNTYVCTVGHLENAGSRVFHIKVIPNSAWVNCGNSSCTINASTAISGNVVDATSSNNSATITSTIQRIADLAITAHTDNSPSSVVGPLKLYVTVKNNGPDDATATGGITLTFTVPTGFVWNSGYLGTFANSATGLTGTACTGTTTLTCTVASGLTAGSTATYALPLTPATTGANAVPANATSITLGTTAGTTSPTVAVAGANVIDNTSANNGPVSYGSVIQRTADISVGLGATADNSPVPISGTLKLYAKVQNFGPDDVTSPVTVTFTLPSGFTYNSAFAGTFASGIAFPNGVCSGTTTVTCTFSSGLTVASGAVTYGLPVIPATTGANSVPATGTSITLGTTGGTTSPAVSISSSNIAENTDAGDGSYSSVTGLHSDGPVSYSSVIQRTSNLQVTLPTTATNSPSSLGGPLKLYATIKNNGPDDIVATTNGITLTFTLPTGFTYNSAFAGTFATGTGLTGAACTGTTTVVCSFSGGLTSGTSTTYALPVTPATSGANSVPASAASITLGTTGGTTAPKVDVTSNGTPNYVNDIATGADGKFSTAASTNLLQTYSGVVIQRTSDVTVTLPGTPDNSPVAISGTLQLFATVQNNGPDDVPSTGTATSALTVTFTLPTGFAYNSSFNSFGGGVTGLTGTACTGTTTVTCKFTSGITVASGATTYALPVTPATSGANSVPASVASITLGTSTGTTHPSVAVTLANASDSTKGTDDSYGVAETSTTGSYSSVIQRQSDLGNGGVTENGPVPLSSNASPLKITTSLLNTGPDAAVGVAVKHVFPATTNNAYTIVSPSTCSKNANVITCTTAGSGALAANAVGQSFVLTVLPDPALVPVTTNQTTITVYTELVSVNPVAGAPPVNPATWVQTVVDNSANGGQNADCTTNPGSNNCGQASPVLQRRSDLGIALPANVASTQKGPLTLTSTISNGGPDQAVSDTNTGAAQGLAGAIQTVPIGSAVVTYTLAQSGWTLQGQSYGAGNCSPDAVGSASNPSGVVSGTTIVCQGTAAINNGASPTQTLSLTPPSNLITSGNTATTTITTNVQSPVVFDSNSGNDNSSTTVTVTRKADLQIVTEANNSPVNSKPNSSTITFSTKIQNATTAGFGDDAPGTIVTYTMPDNTYQLSGNTYPSGCTQPTQGSANDTVITCTVGLLTSGSQQTNTMTVTITSSSVVPNGSNSISKNYSVQVSSPNVVDDGTAGAPGTNNSPTTQPTFVVRRVADLKMPNSPAAGMTDNSPIGVTSGTLTLTNNVQNGGPDDAVNVTVTYTFASTGYVVTGNTYPGGCNAQSGVTVVCNVGTLASSLATTPYTLSVKPDPTWVSNTSSTGTTTVSAVIQSGSVYDNGTGGAANLVAGDNSNSTSPSLRRTSDLQVTTLTDNSHTNPVAIAGPLTFFPTIQNVGPDDAVNVVVTITLPADSSPSSGYRLTTYTGTNPPAMPNCTQPALGSANDNIITCAIGNLTVAAGAVSYGVSVTPDPNGVATNTNVNTPTTSVQVSSVDVIDNGTAGAPGANNTQSIISNLIRQSDLRMNSLTDNSQVTPVTEAGPLNYTTAIQNFGPDTAVGVTVTYTLPTNQYRFNSSFAGTNAWANGACTQPAPGNAGDNVVTCTLPTSLTVAAGAQTFVLSVTPDPAAVPAGAPTVAVPVTAKIASADVYDDGTNGAAGSNNNGAVTSNIERKADLQIVTLTDNSPISQAGPILLTSTVQDAGPDDAVGVIVKYTVPNANYTLATYNGANAYPGGACVQATTVITCTIGSLTKAAGATQFVLAVTPDPAAVATTVNTATATTTAQISSTAVVDDGTSGAPGSNNNGSVLTTIHRLADLAITTLTDNSPIAQNVSLTFTTSIQDLGPDNAVNVVMKYTVPNGSYILGANSYGAGNCTQAGNVITCNVGSLTVAQGAQSFTLSVAPDPNAVATSAASANVSTGVQVSSADVFDNGTGGAAGANNSSSINSTIQRKADLVNVALTDNSPVGSAGPLTFTSQIQNAGPNDAVGVTVSYALPTSGYTLVSQDYGTNACVQAGAIVTCQVGSLTASSAKTNTLSVTPDPNAVSTTNNSGVATTSTSVASADVVDAGQATNCTLANSPALSNNCQQVNSTVQRLVHLIVTAHTSTPAAGTFAPLGTTVTYEVDVQNAATTVSGAVTTAALGVTLDEVLPTTFQNPAVDTVHSDAGWSCDFTQHPNCSFSGSIASGATKKLFITGSYIDDGTTIQLPGGNGYTAGTGSGGTVTATPGTTLSTNRDPLTAVSTHTDIQRLVNLTTTASSNPPGGTQTYANLGSTVLYTIIVNNAASTLNSSNATVATNTATGVFVDVVLPANFTNAAVDASSSAGWTCNFSASPVHCVQANPLGHPGSSTLVLRGSYADDPAVTSLSGGRANVQVTSTPGSTLSFPPTGEPTATTNTDIQRLVHLTATHTSDPVAGSFANLGAPVTYTVIVSNAATVNSATTNTATGVVVNETLPPNFINPTVTSNNWSCNFTGTPAVCTYSRNIGSGTAATDPLTIVGQYSDSTTATILPGGGTYQPGTGNVTVSAGLASTSSFDPTPISVATSTDIKRNVQLTIAQTAPSVDPVALGSTLSYTLQASNAAGFNTAAGVTITDTFPSGFLFTSAAGTNWSCAAPSGGALTCTTAAVTAGGSSNPLVITGSYDTTIALPGSGQGSRTNVGTVGSTLSFNTSGNTTASVISTIQRKSNLAVAITATPNPIGAVPAGTPVGTSQITYTLKVSNTGSNDASGSATSVKVDFTVPLLQNFKNITASGVGTVPVTCDTTSTPGHVICTYSDQTTTTPTVITITGQFDKAAVAQNGSATALSSVTVSTADAVDTSATGKNASSTVTVVDTPVGSSVSPLLNSTGNPITVTYPTVTTAGITTQTVSGLPPIGFHEPAIDYPTVDYSSATPNYFIILSDSSAPVTYTTPVSVCVAYKALAGTTFLKPERVRIFDATGKDITSSLNATTVCGTTNNAPPNLGAFTVREPKNHAPVAKAATQQLFAGKIGTNQFTMDASGSTDADIQQVCNGSTAVCGDTLTYVWTGPPGMNGSTGGNSFTQTVPPKADGTLGAPAQVTGSFPLGVSTVTLTVTDQTGASSTSQVSVTVNSFTLSTTNQSAVISAGQSTSFQVVPQDTNSQPLQFTGNMTLTCNGKKDSDGSTLAANHVACVVSPNPIAQGQFATALLTTTGPNFSQVRPVKPGSSNRSLALVFALMSPALMGIVLVPGRSKCWKVLLLLVILVACLGLQLGCGGSGVAPAIQSQPVQTPSGTYTVTITGTAAGGITSTNTFTLTVK